MTLKFEDLRVLRAAEVVADGIWKQTVQWDAFARDVVGKQLARAADSVGANIAAKNTTRETPIEYVTAGPSDPPTLFTNDDLEWLKAVPNI